MARVQGKLGELLVQEGLLSEQALASALKRQKGSGLKLGQFLVQHKIVDEEAIVNAVSRQRGVERYSKDKFKPSPTLQEIIPENIATRYQVAPLKSENGLVWVAMTDPMDLVVIDDLVRITDLDVEPVICVQSELSELTNMVYGISVGSSELDMGLTDEEGEPELDTSSKDDSYNIATAQAEAEDRPVVKLVNKILLHAHSQGASDVHLSQEQDRAILRYRIDGILLDQVSPPKKYFNAIVSRLKLLSNLDISICRVPQDGRFSFKVKNSEVHVRTSTLPTIYGEKVVMRLHEEGGKTLELEDLGMSDDQINIIKRALIKPHGMILATGPTGSGKTTLLYAILERLNTPGVNIVTLEDPVESRVEGITQIQLNRKAGMTFADGLRSILRQDPDVIMVGEIRDAETAEIAVKAAMTGHKVLSTLHTNDASSAVTRFTEMGVDPFVLSTTLLLVVAQRLARRICSECIEFYEAPASEVSELINMQADQAMHFFRGKGCARCGNMGLKGRVGVYELLEIEPLIQDLIIRKASSKEIQDTAVRNGLLRTLKMDCAEKVFQGITTYEEYQGIAM